MPRNHTARPRTPDGAAVGLHGDRGTQRPSSRDRSAPRRGAQADSHERDGGRSVDSHQKPDTTGSDPEQLPARRVTEHHAVVADRFHVESADRTVDSVSGGVVEHPDLPCGGGGHDRGVSHGRVLQRGCDSAFHSALQDAGDRGEMTLRSRRPQVVGRLLVAPRMDAMPRASQTTGPTNDGMARVVARVELKIRSADAAGQIHSAFAAETPLLIRVIDGRRAVVVAGPRGRRELAMLSRDVASAMVSEYADGARWQVVRLGKAQGRTIAATIRRVEPRHGREATYRYHKCHCQRCRAAHSQALAEWRARSQPAKPEKTASRHGAGCWKRGCNCDEYRRASRERMAAWREKRRAAQTAAGASQASRQGRDPSC